MKDCVLWLDSEVAHIFALNPAGVEKSNFKNHAVGKETEQYFHGLAEKLKGAEQILVMGPGLAKTHFKSHLEKHHHADLSKKIVGVEACDHPTDKEVLAISRKFFKKYDLFNEPI